ncbi:MAG: hypothetical protein AABW91_03165 [Nanoarchaeota archaeon]
MVDRGLQEKHLGILVKNGSFQFSDSFFPYTSGEIGPYYVQSADIMKDGNDYAEAVKDMVKLITSSIPFSKIFDYSNNVISGGESRDWIFSFPVAARLNAPHVMIYKDGKMLGPSLKDKYVIHVADLNNEGSSPRDKWVPAIRNSGGKIENILFYVDRMEDGVKVMQDLGLESHSLVPLDKNAWDYLKSKGIVNNDVYKNLINRMEDKHSWAINMLRSRKGFGKLVELFKDPKSLAKAAKIVNKGYPDLKDELDKKLRENKIINLGDDIYAFQVPSRE